jgi:hypothetical protein
VREIQFSKNTGAAHRAIVSTDILAGIDNRQEIVFTDGLKYPLVLQAALLTKERKQTAYSLWV